MALPLPPKTPVTGCSGIRYDPVVAVQFYTYTFTQNNIPGPKLNLPIVIPEIPIYIPLGKIFTKIPKIESGCEKPKENLVFPGVPCSATMCNKKVCKKILGKNFCIDVPYPCPRFINQIYLDNDVQRSMELFKIPKMGLDFRGNSTSNSKETILLGSNTPIPIWIDLLTQNGILSNNETDMKQVFDKLIVTAKKTISAIFIMLAKYWLQNKKTITFAIRLTELIVDINWNIDYLKLTYGNKVIELRNLTYTFKNINILQLAGAEYIELFFSLTALQPEIVFKYVIGNFKIPLVNPLSVIQTAIQSKITNIKSIANWSENPKLKAEIKNLEDSLNYLSSLGIGELIPGINKNSLNWFKKILELTTINVIVSLNICPLANQTGICCEIRFNLTDYFNEIGLFLKNDVVDGLNILKKYQTFTNTYGLKQLNDWNNLLNKANAEIVKQAKIAAQAAGNAMTNKNQLIYSTLTSCVPL